MPDATPLTPDHPTALKVRDLLTRAGQGDFESIKEIYDPDMVVHSGDKPIAGSTRGMAEMEAKDTQMWKLSDGTLRGVPIHVVANDDQVVVAFHITAQRGERHLDQVSLEVWRMRDGRMVEAWDHYPDQDAWESFWNDPA